MIHTRIIARPQFDAEAVVAFLRETGVEWRRTRGAKQPEELIEIAGRVCYMSFGTGQSPRENAEYIRNLIVQGHESVLEHVSCTFLITGVSRAFTHELVRHRVSFAFSQLSQQYHDESQAAFVEPVQLSAFPAALTAWRAAVQTAQDSYRKIISSLKAAESSADLPRREALRRIRSSARSVLPNATETKVVVTANARALRYFLKVRGSIAGDDEMRSVASSLLEELLIESPALFHDFRVQYSDDGLRSVVHESEVD